MERVRPRACACACACVRKCMWTLPVGFHHVPEIVTWRRLKAASTLECGMAELWHASLCLACSPSYVFRSTYHASCTVHVCAPHLGWPQDACEDRRANMPTNRQHVCQNKTADSGELAHDAIIGFTGMLATKLSAYCGAFNKV